VTKKTRKCLIALVPLLAGIASSCGDTGVTKSEEPTNEDAIYNIIRYDAPSLFNMDLLDFSVPDTLLASAGTVVPTAYWYELDSDSLFIGIDIQYPQPGDPIGTIPVADVSVSKHFFGTFEVIGIDTAGGGSEPVRMSKEFAILGLIDAYFEKFGFDYDSRRGWILTQISDVVHVGNVPGPQGSMGDITIDSPTYPDHVVDTSIKELPDVLIFSPGESLSVSIDATNPGDYITLRYPSDGALISLPVPADENGDHITGFRLPVTTGFGHFLLESIYEGTITDTLSFRSRAVGVLYRIR
jgi:hypothetical protein